MADQPLILAPQTTVPGQVPTVEVLPAGSPEVPALVPTSQVQAQTAQLTAEQTRELQAKFFKWGIFGVVLGASANTLVTAMAFKSYGAKGASSPWKPALWAGFGSLCVGGGLLWLLAQSMSQPLDGRLLTTALGTKLAL